MLFSAFLSRTLFLVAGTLYPAYASFKAVRTKNPRAYVKWMMYWIVFACYLFIENFTDSFLSWVPFYYEMKILVILWMVLPMTRGSSYLYRSWIHPFLKKQEPRIDEGLSQVSQTGVRMLRRASIMGFNLATQTVVTGAIRGHEALGEALGRPSTSEPDGNVCEQSSPPGVDDEYLIIGLDEDDVVEQAEPSNSGMAHPVQSMGRQEDEVGNPPREELVGLPPREGTPPREPRASRRRKHS